MSLAPRYLMLLAGMLLAFPQGWCCAAVMVFVSDAESVPVTTCCGHHQPAPSCDETTDDNPLRSPMPVTCCCAIKSTLPPGPKVSTPELDLTGIIVLPIEEPIQVLTAATEVADPFWLSVSPRLLHCVWLC